MNRYIVSLLLIMLCFNASAQNNKIDSLRKALAGEKEDTNRVNTLNHLSEALCRVSMLDSAMVYANKAKETAEKSGFERGLSSTYCNLANANCYLGNKLKAIEYANKALEISRKFNDAKFTAFALNLLGLTYMGVRDYSKALDAFSSSISVSSKSGDKRNLCACRADIGIIYVNQNNYAKALEFDTLALATAREINYTGAFYALQNNIGVIYAGMKNYNKAKEYYEQAFVSGEKLGDKLSPYTYNSNIADIYSAEGNYPKALECKYKALLIIKEVGKKNDIAKAYSDIGQVYYSLKNYTAAKPSFDSALDISTSIGELEIMKVTYQYLYLLDSVKGDTKTGLEDYKNYIFYRDSVANQENGQKAAQSEMDYNFARKMDSAQAAQDKLNVIAENEKGRQKVIEYSLGGGLTLAFVASGIFFFQRRRISKERQKLKESNEVKDKLFSIISHDLRSPLNLLSGMLGLFKRGKVTAENSEALSQNLESSMQNTMSLLDNLLSWSHSQMKGFNIKPEKLDLGEVALDIVNLYSNA
ncbi:MAG TPA: tetratricopeptide repeat protein, partial [Bacteroidia bacterium]|nr:tetratricopeptide repeat protein [Bacteroidia bacterium]